MFVKLSNANFSTRMRKGARGKNAGGKQTNSAQVLRNRGGHSSFVRKNTEFDDGLDRVVL